MASDFESDAEQRRSWREERSNKAKEEEQKKESVLGVGRGSMVRTRRVVSANSEAGGVGRGGGVRTGVGGRGRGVFGVGRGKDLRRCFVGNRIGHISHVCPDRKIPSAGRTCEMAPKRQVQEGSGRSNRREDRKN